MSDKAILPGKARLSIILATFQAVHVLERCLNSIVGQDFIDWELLIVDGGSNDGTVDLIRQFDARLTWWESAKDRGIYDAWNKALGHARGEYVCFIGADDAFADSGSLSRLFDAIGPKRCDLVTSRGEVVDRRAEKKWVFGSPWDYKRIGPRMIVCHPGLLHRRSLFNRYGSFDTQYQIAGDLEFLLRLPSAIRTLHVDSVSVVIESDGVSRTKVLNRLREQRRILASCDRYGPVHAYLTWLNKLWRLPIARLLNIPH
jgi:glycosyltransferase involved in cell wall biosynthesis